MYDSFIFNTIYIVHKIAKNIMLSKIFTLFSFPLAQIPEYAMGFRLLAMLFTSKSCHISTLPFGIVFNQSPIKNSIFTIIGIEKTSVSVADSFAPINIRVFTRW